MGMAVLPVAGLLVCERLLRGVVADSNSRWTYSGVVAILLVNLVMASYVLWCFWEGFPDAVDESAKGTAPSEKGQGAASLQGKETEHSIENRPPNEIKKDI